VVDPARAGLEARCIIGTTPVARKRANWYTTLYTRMASTATGAASSRAHKPARYRASYAAAAISPSACPATAVIASGSLDTDTLFTYTANARCRLSTVVM
jgi:hypothetical protein